MRVQIKSTSVLNEWLPAVEQACADADDQERQDAFVSACSAAGLSDKHRVVRALAGDLTRIRPPDVWLRIIASHLTKTEGEQFPLKALDHGLSSLRLADAYVSRANVDTEIAAALLAAVVRQMPYLSVDRWRDWHANRGLVASDDGDVFRVCSDAGRYAPLSMVTVVGSHFGDWAALFTPLVENLGALEYCASEIVAWRRGDRRKRGLNVRWVETPPTCEERLNTEAALNAFAESVQANWQSTKTCVSPKWSPLLEETIAAVMQFAVIAVELMNGNADG